MMHPTVPEIAAALHAPQMLSASVIDTGQNNFVLATDTLIVRVPRHSQARSDLAWEANVLAVLASQLPLPVPATELRTIGTHAIAVHPKLPGKPLLSVAELDDEHKQELASSLAGFLRDIHAIALDALPARAADDHLAEWRDLFSKVEAKVFPLVPREIGASIRDRFDSFLADGNEPPARAIIHGDFGPGNILIDGGCVSGIIDFAGSGPGDPAYDFASLSAGLGDDFVALMEPHYPDMAMMRDRVRFYRGTFPLLDVLFGVEHGDANALEAGLETLMRGPSPQKS